MREGLEEFRLPLLDGEYLEKRRREKERSN
jgi:hypothetical protein